MSCSSGISCPAAKHAHILISSRAPRVACRHMQGLLRCRGYDLADEHRCLLVSLQDCAPEALPADAKPLPPEFGKRKLVNFLPGSCMKLR